MGRNHSGRGHHGELSRTIVIDQSERQMSWRIMMECVAAGQQYPHRSVGGPIHHEEVLRDRRRNETDGDPLREQPIPQKIGGVASEIVNQMNTSSTFEGWSEFP